MTAKKLRFESSSLVYLIICAAAVALFLGVGIYPNRRAIKQLDAELADLKTQIDAQVLLNPVFRSLIEEGREALPASLPTTQVGKIDQSNLGRLIETFTELARANGVTLQRVVPDAESYREDSDRLNVNAVFIGDFFDFRSLVMEICRLPFIDSIEQLRIETDQETKRLTVRLELLQ